MLRLPGVQIQPPGCALSSHIGTHSFDFSVPNISSIDPDSCAFILCAQPPLIIARLNYFALACFKIDCRSLAPGLPIGLKSSSDTSLLRNTRVGAGVVPQLKGFHRRLRLAALYSIWQPRPQSFPCPAPPAAARRGSCCFWRRCWRPARRPPRGGGSCSRASSSSGGAPGRCPGGGSFTESCDRRCRRQTALRWVPVPPPLPPLSLLQGRVQLRPGRAVLNPTWVLCCAVLCPSLEGACHSRPA